MFGFIKKKLRKIYEQVTVKIHALFSRGNFDEAFFNELRDLLLEADVGFATTESIIKDLRSAVTRQGLSDSAAVKQALENVLVAKLLPDKERPALPSVLLMVGINGSGKTTFLAKLAHACRAQNKKVLLVGGDTFRAAATDQLAAWAHTVGVDVFLGRAEQDAASVIFDACQRFTQGGYDNLLIDTAGRLQTKINLMKELEKIHRVLAKALPSQVVSSWLSVDSMLGQNSLRQAEVFHETTRLDGIVLTKFDGTGKGGIVFAIADQFKIPVVYITCGEDPEALKFFNPREFVQELLGE